MRKALPVKTLGRPVRPPAKSDKIKAAEQEKMAKEKRLAAEKEKKKQRDMAKQAEKENQNPQPTAPPKARHLPKPAKAPTPPPPEADVDADVDPDAEEEQTDTDNMGGRLDDTDYVPAPSPEAQEDSDLDEGEEPSGDDPIADPAQDESAADYWEKRNSLNSLGAFNTTTMGIAKAASKGKQAAAATAAHNHGSSSSPSVPDSRPSKSASRGGDSLKSALIPQKRPATESTSARVKPKCSDYDAQDQAILADAKPYFKAICATEDAYMESHDLDEAALDAWEWACARRGIKRKPDKKQLKIIKETVSGFRYTVKLAARAAVKTEHSFKHDNKTNAEFAELLLDRYAFIFKDPGERRGIYESPAIAEVINTVWFRNKKDAGVVYHKAFNPIRLPNIALAAAAVEFAITEWVTGTHTDTAWTAEYAPRYREQIDELEAWQEEDPAGFARLQTKLFEDGCLHAAVNMSSFKQPTKRRRLDKADFKRAQEDAEPRVEEVA